MWLCAFELDRVRACYSHRVLHHRCRANGSVVRRGSIRVRGPSPRSANACAFANSHRQRAYHPRCTRCFSSAAYGARLRAVLTPTAGRFLDRPIPLQFRKVSNVSHPRGSTCRYFVFFRVTGTRRDNGRGSRHDSREQQAGKRREDRTVGAKAPCFAPQRTSRGTTSSLRCPSVTTRSARPIRESPRNALPCKCSPIKYSRSTSRWAN